ncbi:MAG TPA: pyridoxal-phosphate dependent enzyme [Pyrinomonadaceae bacterium]|jgi:threonine dehydratase
MEAPTFRDVLSARRAVAPYLRPTPLGSYPALDRLLGARAVVKHENMQPTGAFKVRGGVNLVSRLAAAERAAGVVSASTGNHGQSIAYAARLFGVRATIVVPEGANPLKVEAMRDLGAEVVFHGADFDEARVRCEALARETGARYVHSANEPLLVAGVATCALEIFEEEPETEVVYVAVGGGSGAAGACLVARAVSPRARVVGVQAEKAPAAHASWRARRLLEARMETEAEGLATRVAFELTQRMLWEMLDDFVLVSEEEIRLAARHYAEAARSLAEGAGAAALAGALKSRHSHAGRRVAVVLSGGNVTLEQLRRTLA